MSLSAFWKTGQNPYKNKHGENCIAQVVCWHFVRLCGAAGVGGEVSFKKQSKHIHIRTAFSTTRIHKENRQVLKYQPTLLKTLTNIIYCMCLFQHVGKQDRTHARTHMVKIALRKLFAGILCGCVVLLVLVAKWVMKKKSKPIHILTALFTTGIHKEYKQVLPYRPTSWKPWPTSSTVRVSVTTFENRTGSMQEQIWSKLHCASCLLAFCAVVWCCLCCCEVSEGKKPSKPIHILTALFTTRVHKENKQVLKYQPTSGKLVSVS